MFLCGCTKTQQPMDLYDAIKQRGKIVVGVKASAKPFSFTNSDGAYQGYDIDIAKRIARDIFGKEDAIEFKPVAEKDRIMVLNSGEADLIIATMTITPQREAVVDFSDPYYYASQTLMTRRDSKFTSPSDKNLKRIGVLFGTTAEKSIRIVAPQALVSGFRTYPEAVQALRDKRIDAVATDDTIVRGIIADDKSLKMMQNVKLSKEPYGVALRKGEETKRLKATVNNVISSMGSDGSFTQLNRKWIK